MKRNMDLIREILLEIESSSEQEIYDFSIDGYSEDEIKYNLKLLSENKMIDHFSEDVTGSIIVGQITWNGNDYLDKVRDDSIWRKTKDTITQKGLPLIFETIKTVATAFITATAEGVANSILKNGGAL